MSGLDARAERGHSTIYVLGELEPPEIAFFNADEIPVAPDLPTSARVEVLGHAAGYWVTDVWEASANAARLEGERVLRLAFAAYALLGGQPFTVRVHNWVEVKDVVSYRTVLGMQSARFAEVELLPSDAPENTALREAVALAGLALERPLHRLALRDLHAGLREPGLDAFLYAYRAVEAIRQAIAPDEGDERQWAAMHEKLETEREVVMELADLAQLVRHAKEDDPKVAAVRDEPERIRVLGIARDVLLREFAQLLGRRPATLRALRQRPRPHR